MLSVGYVEGGADGGRREVEGLEEQVLQSSLHKYAAAHSSTTGFIWVHDRCLWVGEPSGETGDKDLENPGKP